MHVYINNIILILSVHVYRINLHVISHNLTMLILLYMLYMYTYVFLWRISR